MTELDCSMALLAQADFDGELDVGRAADLAQHRAGCARCQAAYAELAALKSAIQAADLREAAPEALRGFAASLSSDRPAPASAALAQGAGAPTGLGARDGATRPGLGWLRWPALNFGLGAAMATAVALLAIGSGPEIASNSSTMVDQVVDDHIRALQPGHLEDVISTDRHTVKPWFEGKLDFAPPVKDLADKQFPLIGGRLDALGGRPIAALIYKRGTHPIDLLVWPATKPGSPVPVTSEHNGFTVIHWTQGSMSLWAVSDVEQNQLEDFVRLWRVTP